MRETEVEVFAMIYELLVTYITAWESLADRETGGRHSPSAAADGICDPQPARHFKAAD
jgi:hypothetical protein